MRIAFVMNDLSLSGGNYVVLEHAQRLASEKHHEVTLVLRDAQQHQWAVQFLAVLQLAEWTDAKDLRFDVAIATYWETLGHLGHLTAENYVWFCQSLEDRFFPDRNPHISSVQLASGLPIPVLTEASWIADFFTFANPDREVKVVRNGIDKGVFFAGTPLPPPSGRIRVLVEGPLNSRIKNTEYALSSALRADSTDQLTHIGSAPYPTQDSRYTFIPSNLDFHQMSRQYRDHHVLLKTSLVEGMFGPPLEAFHCGTPAIVTPVTGAEEYIRDEVNALVVPWDDEGKVARQINRVATEDNLWGKLRQGALDTAAAWPRWDEQTQEFEKALLELRGGSSLGQSELRHLSAAISFNGSLHWLAMRRLSDKSGGIQLVEKAWLERHPSVTQKFFGALKSGFRL